MDSIDVVFSKEIECHNEEVSQNRSKLATISEAVLYLAKQELTFRGHDESDTSLNKGTYRKLLECLMKFDPVFEQ